MVRITSGKCCKWCDKLAGSYKYPDVPSDVYKRHLNCDCLVEYHPGDGKKQNVHSREWTDVEKSAKIEKRKLLSTKPKILKKDDILTNNFTRGPGKNYPIKMSGSQYVKFNSEFVRNVTVIAGNGTSVDIRDVNRLENIYLQPKNRWQKISGVTYIICNREKIKVEIHWYEANGKRHLIKVKRSFENES